MTASVICPHCNQPNDIWLSGGTTLFDCAQCGGQFSYFVPQQPVSKWPKVPNIRLSLTALKVIYWTVAALILAAIVWQAVKDSGAQAVAQSIPMLIFMIVALGCAAAVYFIPSIIAYRRGHRNVVGIAIVNAAFGWTLLGWIGALVWAAYREKP